MTDNQNTVENNRPDIAETAAALTQDVDGVIPSTVLYGLSHLTDDELAQLEPSWKILDVPYRRKVVAYLVDVSEANFELDYNKFGNYALNDPDAGVRKAAVELLFEDTSIDLMDRLIEMAQWDEAPSVRAAAATALGRFIYVGEMEEIPERDAIRAQEAMISIWTNDNEDVEVRRRALESIANCSIDFVEEAIKDAYSSYEQSLQVSALYAMGRSYDPQWGPIVIRELDSDDPEKIYEAARAAGELELKGAVVALVHLANGSDREIAEVAITSLGEIGGHEAVRALDSLGSRAEAADDQELVEVIEDAMALASLSEIDFGDEWDD